jgi:hypothetical protein
MYYTLSAGCCSERRSRSKERAEAAAEAAAAAAVPRNKQDSTVQSGPVFLFVPSPKTAFGMVSGGRRGSAAVLCLLGLAASQICYTRAFTPLSGSRSVHRRSRVRQVTLINQGLGKGRGVLPYGLPLLAEGGELEVEGTPPPPPSSDATTSAAAPATPDAKPRSPEAQRLALEAERLKLQAEKLRLEAEKERLVLEQEKLKKKEVLIQAQDSFIKQLRSRWKGGVEVEEEEEGLADFVKRSIDTVDTTLFLRLADLAEMAAGDATEREELIALSQDVMRAVEAHDAAKATQLSESIKKRCVCVCVCVCV